VGAPGEVGVFAGSHVAHDSLQEAGERLALARVDLRGRLLVDSNCALTVALGHPRDAH
jgi:hypothetical protein